MSRFSSEPVQIDWLSMDVGVVKRCMCPEKTAVKGWRDAEQQTALVLARRFHLISSLGSMSPRQLLHSRLIYALFQG